MAEMTPNGTVFFVIVSTITLLIPIKQPIPIACTISFTLFILLEGYKHLWASIRYAVLTVVPISIMLTIMWGGIIGAPPDAMETAHQSGKVEALIYVLRLTTRLFLFVLLIHSALSSKLEKTPIRFLSQLALPVRIKQTVAMTLSIASTIRNATERAWIALVASNIITPRRSLRNILHTWLFLQTIWTFMISTINERISGKWKIENIDTMLRDVFKKQKYIPTMKDILWICLSIITMISTAVFEH